MTTEDETVSVLLHAGLQLKRDEFTAAPPQLSVSRNVDNEAEIGAAKQLPEMHDLTSFGAGADPLAIVPGNNAICMIRESCKPAIYNEADQSWAEDNVTTACKSADVVGMQIISALRPITDIAHGGTDTYDVYAWLENDEVDGAHGATLRYVVRSGDANIGPFEIPKAAGFVKFDSICMTRGTTETYLYAVEHATVRTITGYQVEVDGTLTSFVVQSGFNTTGVIDVVEQPLVDPNRKHHLAFCRDGNSIHRIYDITAQGAIVTNEFDNSNNGTGTGVAIDFDGTNICAIYTIEAASGGGIESAFYDPADFAGTLVTDQESQTIFEPSRVTLRNGRDGFVGAWDERKDAPERAEATHLFSITAGGLIFQRSAPLDIFNMRLTGDAYLDEDGGVILPMTFTTAVDVGSTGVSLVEGTWPVDPAIVGYLYNLQSFDPGKVYALHPVARWGVDRVRTDWGRSKLSMPYAGDPKTPLQEFGRSLLDVTVVQRQTSANAVLGLGGSLFGTSVPQVFDGRNFIPVCHLWRPTIKQEQSIAAGSTAAGTYNYRAVFIWEDDTGLLIRSADSSPLAHVAAGGGNVELAIATHQPPHHGGGVENTRLRVWVYATEDMGTNFYLLTDANGDPAEAVAALGAGNSLTFSVDDGAGDPSNPILTFQTTPPEIAPLCPNGFHDVDTAHNRVWGIDAEDRGRVWGSKIMSRFQPPEFSALLVQDFPEEDGELEAIGVVNGNPMFFKRHSIWALQGGQGPSNLVGIGQPYARPVKVAHSGTTNRRSVVSFPGGVVFHNGRSLMLLGQGLQVVPFGLEIQPAIAGGVVTGAAHVSARRELHFNFDVPLGIKHFVYSYDVDLWSEWADFTFIDELISKDSRFFLRPDSTGEIVQLEETGVDPDLGVVRATAPLTVTTHYIRPGDRNAARRVREVLVEFRKVSATLAGSVTISITEEHRTSTGSPISRGWTAAEIDAAYPPAFPFDQRIILRVSLEEQFESAQVSVQLSGDMPLRPVSCAVTFGVEAGVQRRYPEGSTK